MTSLTILNLSHNKLEFLSQKLFANNKNLQEININDNKLKIIENKIFSDLNHVTKINLEKNFCIDKSFAAHLTAFSEYEKELVADCGNPLETVMNNYKESIEKLELDNSKKDKMLSNVTNEVEVKRAKIVKLNENLIVLAGEKEKLETETSKLKLEIEILGTNHTEARNKTEEVLDKIIELTAELAALNKTNLDFKNEREKDFEEKVQLKAELAKIFIKFDDNKINCSKDLSQQQDRFNNMMQKLSNEVQESKLSSETRNLIASILGIGAVLAILFISVNFIKNALRKNYSNVDASELDVVYQVQNSD